MLQKDILSDLCCFSSKMAELGLYWKGWIITNAFPQQPNVSIVQMLDGSRPIFEEA